MAERHILLVEPFLGGSHEAWANGWRRHSRHRITVIGHEGRHWRWRMRGASVSLAREVVDRRAELGSVDLLVGSNMLDLPSFVGLARLSPSLPSALYLHENQLSYPRQEGETLDGGLAWMQWRGLVGADEVWCNSDFHRRELLAGIDRLLADPLDHDHRLERDALAGRMHVIEPGIELAALGGARTRAAGGRPLLVSNQRWHHDKDVGSVLRAFRRLLERGHDVEFALLGDHDGGEGEALRPAVDALGDRVVVDAMLPRDAYLDVLRRADIVVSAARGENFGIAVAEAIAAGAWPVVPNALAYPEVLPPSAHARCLFEPGGLGALLDDVVTRVGAGESPPAELAPSMARFDWSVIAGRLDDRVDTLTAAAGAV